MPAFNIIMPARETKPVCVFGGGGGGGGGRQKRGRLDEDV